MKNRAMWDNCAFFQATYELKYKALLENKTTL